MKSPQLDMKKERKEQRWKGYISAEREREGAICNKDKALPNRKG
jgi:hypothetical protein